MKRIHLLLLPILLSLGAALASAQKDGKAAPASQAAAATIRIWGDPAMQPMLESWEQGFGERDPEVRFENRLLGSVTAIAGVDHQVAQIAALGRPLGVDESMSFEWIYRYKPLTLKVSSGSVNRRGELPALAIFVNRANPIARLSLDQLRTIFSCCGGAKGEAGYTVLWGDFSDAASWAHRPVHPMGPSFDKGEVAFFRANVLHGSRQWNCAYRSFLDSRAMIRAVADDRGAIAIGTMADADSAVKVVPLAGPDGVAIVPDRDSVADHIYPLARYTYLVVNRGPDRPLDAPTLRFLRYVLSKQGQAAIGHGSGFLPLPESVAVRQRAILDPQGKPDDSHAKLTSGEEQ